MKQVFVVFDDRIEPPVEIRRVIGSKSFGNVILRRRTLFERIREQSGCVKVLLLEDNGEESFSAVPEEAAILHLFSAAAVANEEEYRLILQKAAFAEENYQVSALGTYGETSGEEIIPAGAVFADKRAWRSVLAEEREPKELRRRFVKFPRIKSDAFLDLTDTQRFLSFLTGGFEARFFNRLDGDEFTVTKRSENRDKIRAEYEYYRLLPEAMKPWFVQPYDYREDERGASYTMERMHMTDLAIRFVHGAIGIEEFERILSALFRFISIRSSKEVSSGEAEGFRKKLYIDKVRERMDEFLSKEPAAGIEEAVAALSPYSGIRAIVEDYEALYTAFGAGRPEKNVLVVGHGDLCFSNILYQPDADIIRFIDPKGCLTLQEAYTDPYYDVAKLSHSVCGGYDLINSAQYQIAVDEDLRMRLRPDLKSGEYAELFKKYASRAGFRFELVRLFECSLFLSMLPLHIDRPRKVLAFILNAAGIIEELKRV